MKKLVDKLPKSVQERVFIVRTGLDVNLQRQSEQAVEETLRDYGRQYGARQAATTVMDNDGTVRAIVGGRDYSESQFNRATDAQRQPGSSFKPYVYSVAFMHGLKPTTRDRGRADLHRQLVPAQLFGRLFRLAAR